MAEYPEWKRAACGWCRSGAAMITESLHVGSDWYTGVCLAPTEAQHIEQLTARVAELEAQIETQGRNCKFYADRAFKSEAANAELRTTLELRNQRVHKLNWVGHELEAANAALRTALIEIRDAKSRWMQDVGSYAGGETYAGFASRLQQIAESALSSAPVATEVERQQAREEEDAKEGAKP